MTDHEFDNYLALLAKLLRLGEVQRQAIAGELRAHLEDRLDDLLARGVPKHQAVKQALEEFGDAAVLASEFVSISRGRRRRWIMRLTTASVAAIVLIAAGIFTFWPGTNAGPGAAAVIAQNPAAPGSTAKETTPQAAQALMLKDRLDQPIDCLFLDTPLADALRFLREKAGVQFVIKTKQLEEAGANVDVPVTLSLENVKLRILLELVLDQHELAYICKDELIFITTPEDAESPENMVVRVYDCRELLELPRPPGSIRSKVAPGRGGLLPAQDQPPAEAPAEGGEADSDKEGGGAAPAAPAGISGLGGFSGEFVPLRGRSDADDLIEVITTTVDPVTWSEVGGAGAIAEYKGLVTVSTTQGTHEGVERLLNMLHRAAGLKEQRVKVVE